MKNPASPASVALPSHTAVGRAAERLVLQRYEAGGFRLVASNVRVGRLEIDLIVERSGVIVFCEVKSRRSTSHGHPAEFVNGPKRTRTRTAAAAWLERERMAARSIRFDVACVLGEGRAARIELYPNAF